MYLVEGSTWNKPILFCVTTQITELTTIEEVLQLKLMLSPKNAVLTVDFVKSISSSIKISNKCLMRLKY